MTTRASSRGHSRPSPSTGTSSATPRRLAYRLGWRVFALAARGRRRTAARASPSPCCGARPRARRKACTSRCDRERTCSTLLAEAPLPRDPRARSRRRPDAGRHDLGRSRARLRARAGRARGARSPAPRARARRRARTRGYAIVREEFEPGLVAAAAPIRGAAGAIVAAAQRVRPRGSGFDDRLRGGRSTRRRSAADELSRRDRRRPAGTVAALTALWHPFADMAAVDGAELVLVRGEGVFVWDDAGPPVSRRRVEPLVRERRPRPHARSPTRSRRQLAELESFHVFGDLANRPARDLAERLARLAPQPGSKVFLTSGGGDRSRPRRSWHGSVHVVRGEPERRHLISRDGRLPRHARDRHEHPRACRTRTSSAHSCSETSQVAWDEPAALEAEIERLGAESVAAFVFEPVIGSGGVLATARPATSRRHGDLPPSRRADDRRQRDRRLRSPRHVARRRAVRPANPT